MRNIETSSLCISPIIRELIAISGKRSMHDAEARRSRRPGRAQWLALQIVWQGRCAYCRCPAPVQADHRIPLARGGMNGIDNILPACATCNQRKHLLTEDEFRARLARQRGDAA